MNHFSRIVIVLIDFLLVVKAEVTLFPRDVRVCPDQEELVVITCNQSSDIEQLGTLQWQIQVPGMPPMTSILVSERHPMVTPLPGVDAILENISGSTILSSLTVEASNFTLTSSDKITVSCGLDDPPPTTVIQLWDSPSVSLTSFDCKDINHTTYEVMLLWSLTNGLPPAAEYTIAFIPSLTLPLMTNNTMAKLTLNKGTNYTVDITANTCVGNATTTHAILMRAECFTEQTSASNICTDNCTPVTSLSTIPEPTTIAREGLRNGHIATIAAVSALFVCILFIVFIICAIILVSRKKPVKAENAVADMEAVQMDAGYSHFGFHTRESTNIQQEEEYSTLNLPKPPGKQKIKSNYEQQKNEDCYDYCTIGGVIQTNTQPKPMEMSGSYALIGHDHTLEKDEVSKERKKGTVHRKTDKKVEYAEVQIKTKPEDNLLNLDCVLILIRDVASKWEDLANEFSAPKDEIDYIRKTTAEDYDRLVEVCDWWIKRLHEKNSQPTWRTLSKALKRIGFADLAKEIMEIYKTGKLPERVTASPDIPDVLASIAAGNSNLHAPIPPYTASAATPATPSASAMAPDSTYDDVLSATAKSTELTTPSLPPPISPMVIQYSE